MMSLNLRPETEARLTALAAASSVSVDDYLAALVEKLSLGDKAAIPAQGQPASQPMQHIADIIVESMKDVPPEIMATMPTDGASQHDHYIYGWPKRDV